MQLVNPHELKFTFKFQRRLTFPNPLQVISGGRLAPGVANGGGTMHAGTLVMRVPSIRVVVAGIVPIIVVRRRIPTI